jgi:large subunit ribosomal protein L5
MATATAAVTPRLKERYDQEIRPALIERFGLSSIMQAPRLEKITVNMGVGDAKQDSKLLDQATEQLGVVAGQRPSVRRARKSIAGFKIRDGMPVGVAVTLRGARMYEFLDRLTAVALPRVRDFRGLNPRAFDGRGNYTLGVREQIIFPEIDYDAIDQVRGLDISITTTTDDDTQAFVLLRELGMPFADGGPDEAPLRGPEDERGGPSQPDAIDSANAPADAESVAANGAGGAADEGAGAS